MVINVTHYNNTFYNCEYIIMMVFNFKYIHSKNLRKKVTGENMAGKKVAEKQERKKRDMEET